MRFLRIKRHLTSFQIIILGFIAVVFLGALLLMLPVSSQKGYVTSFNESLFTSVSAACVTGLVVHDTASYWSLFGKAVILILIQVGGIGVITVAVSLARLSGRKISLMQRSTVQESINASKAGGIVALTSFIIKAVLVFELFGALIMLPVFCKDFGVRGIWMAVFHSVSAFCNAGFDVMGTTEVPFASLTSYTGNYIINITVILLIVIGGIGFLTWNDIKINRYRFRHYSMQSKVILTTSAILIIVPTVYFYFFEFTEYPTGERVLNSLFQSVTTRTAGFNTTDLTKLTGAGKCIFIVLMLVGGSPGSTAGGMKTTTLAVLFAAMLSVFRRKSNPHYFGRRINDEIIKKAAAILMMYIMLFVGGALIISVIETLPIGVCLFETASAVGTVGLSLGLTPGLGIVSQCILMALMFIGRVGGLTIIFAAVSKNKASARFPEENITVG
ncbi:MAG: Trk family potassium uptake protein [Oscillospiraceae bacterium]|nr:Trk family potassium uptake protein [Oscillospiraceae bacterium]